MASSEPPGIRIDVVRVETIRFFSFIQSISNLFDFLLEDRSIRYPAEVEELQMKRSDFRENRLSSIGPSVVAGMFRGNIKV